VQIFDERIKIVLEQCSWYSSK